MLLTRCPDCRTTFRITSDALEAADGQVRCGRCSTIFDAREELSEEPTVEAPMISPASADIAEATPGHVESDSIDAGPVTADLADDAIDDPLARTDEYYVPDDAFDSLMPDTPDDEPGDAADAVERSADAAEAADTAGEDTVEEPEWQSAAPWANVAPMTGYENEAALSSVIAEIRRQQGLAEAIPPEQVDEVLGSEADRSDAVPAPWAPARSTRSRPSRWWAVAAVLAVIALAVQLVHYYRAELAAQPVIGTWLSVGYSQLGIEVVPNWDLGQYQIMDWVASAAADDQVQSSLNITARIRNRGPSPQPFPHVLLELKDRWDTPVGSRIFQPNEYMDATGSAELMAPGQTVRAQMSVMDPGENAYGFQLDVCVPASQGGLRCATDDIFR